MRWSVYRAGVTISMILSLGMTDRRVSITIVGVLLYRHSYYLQYTVMIQEEGDVGNKVWFESTE